MKTRLFVSYTSKDPSITEERLKQVDSKLKPFASLFIDRLHNKCGGQYRVDFELWRCDAMIQIVSEYQSKWSQAELVYARKKGKPVVKVTMDDLLNKDEEQLVLMVNNLERKSWSVWSILTVALLVCLGISFLGMWLSYDYVANQDEVTDVLNARGVFGDSWGGVNAIISAFAFAGVIVTLFLQNRDLNLQRKEMARQREEFEKENETLKYQRFENLFYNMLNLQQEIVAGLRYEYTEEEYVLVPSGNDTPPVQDKKRINRVVTGREVFRYTFERADIYLNERDQFNQRIIVHGYRGFLNNKGLSEYDETWIPTIFDHYFRHLYKIIQFVDKQGFSFDETYKYVSLLRGTLSRYELVWIYYNALNPVYHNFQELIEKYSLLKNMREDLLTQSKELATYYSGLGLSWQDVKDAGFTTRDFELFLTDDKNDAEKYYITAFWKVDEEDKGLNWLNRWRSFVDDAAGKVIEKV